MGTYGRNGSGARRYGGFSGESFSKSKAAYKYYSYGSQAVKVDEIKSRATSRRLQRIEKNDKRYSVKDRVAMALCVIIVCSVALAALFVKSMVYDYKLENEKLMRQLETEKEETISITAQSNEKLDIAYVEQAATTKLNMAKPQSYQIVYIEVPKSEYTISHDAFTVIEKEKLVAASYKSASTFASNVKKAVTVMASKAKNSEDEDEL